MALDRQKVVSAQVVLRGASGRRPRGEIPITAANVGDFLPSSDSVTRATEAFARAGFQVGAVAGNSFSISAPVCTFEETFKARLRQKENGAIEVVSQGGEASYELPLSAVSNELAKPLESVTFTPPPDFGPTSY